MDHIRTILIWIKDSAINALICSGIVSICLVFYGNEVVSSLPTNEIPQSDWNALGVRLIVILLSIGGVIKCIEVFASFIVNKSN